MFINYNLFLGVPLLRQVGLSATIFFFFVPLGEEPVPGIREGSKGGLISRLNKQPEDKKKDIRCNPSRKNLLPIK